MASIELFSISLDLTVEEGDAYNRNLTIGELEQAFPEAMLAKKLAHSIALQVARDRNIVCQPLVALAVPKVGEKCRLEAKLEIPKTGGRLFSTMPDYLDVLWGEVRVLSATHAKNNNAPDIPKRFSRIAKKLVADAQAVASKRLSPRVVIHPASGSEIKINAGLKRTRSRIIPRVIIGSVRLVDDDNSVVRVLEENKGAGHERRISLYFLHEHRDALIELMRTKSFGKFSVTPSRKSGGLDGQLVSVELIMGGLLHSAIQP